MWNFDHEGDAIQVLRQPQPAYAGTELVPQGFHNSPGRHLGRIDPRDLHDAGRLLWQDMGPEADAAFRLVAIDAIFYLRSVLCGLRFRYAGGAEREVGNCTVGNPRQMQSIEIGDDEIVYFGRYKAAIRGRPADMDAGRPCIMRLVVSLHVAYFTARSCPFSWRASSLLHGAVLVVRAGHTCPAHHYDYDCLYT